MTMTIPRKMSTETIRDEGPGEIDALSVTVATAGELTAVTMLHISKTDAMFRASVHRKDTTIVEGL
jgi:hypothetical protein